MNQQQETYNTWNKVARLYQENFMDLNIYDASYDQFCNLLNKENARILDVGCGPGNITRYLLSKNREYEIDGIDFSPNMIQLAAGNNPTAKFRVLDSRDISRITKKYNGIICGFCIPYLSTAEVNVLIKDVQDLLLNDGIVYISFVDGDENNSGFKTASTGDRTFFYYHNTELLTSELVKTGFTILASLKVVYKKSSAEDELHSIIICRKSEL